MGANNSKKSDCRPSEDPNPEDPYFVSPPIDEEISRLEVNIIRKEYMDKHEMFLLNQMLFSVMFFQNYPQELAESMPNETISVQKLSLTDEHFLTCLKPDEALSLVNKHVLFCAKHGPLKDIPSPLVQNRIFVIHENMQVVAESENHYANIDRPSLTAQVVEKHRKGYVRLKYIEDNKFKNSVSSSSSTLTNSSVEDKNDTYGRITQSRIIKPMPQMDPKTMKKTLYSIKEIKMKNLNAGDDDDLYLYEYFVNSQAMMKQFLEKWSKISKLLELDNHDIQAGYNNDSVYCCAKSGDLKCEIIPAVQLPKGAYEKFIRTKSENFAIASKTENRMTFPSIDMLNEIVDMDRLAIPRGFLPKYSDEVNKKIDLEWELAHPKVEKYLQQQFTQTHVRILLLLMLVHKSFVEPKTTNQGLTMRHLVIHLFWELEKNVVVDETRMGMRLVEMISSLCNKLGKGVLADYFIEERNHFENVPSHGLRQALNEFASTRDRPLRNFMTAIRNLSYVHKAIPELDVKALHTLLIQSKQTKTKEIEPRKTEMDWATKRRNQLSKEEKTTNLKFKVQKRVSTDSIIESEFIIGTTETPNQLKRNKEVLVLFLDHYINMATSLNQLGNITQARSFLRQAELITYVFHRSRIEEANEYQNKIKTIRHNLEEATSSRINSNIEYRRRSQNESAPILPTRTSSVYIPQYRLISQNIVDMKKVTNQTSEIKPKLVKNRIDSKSFPDNDSSDGDFKNSPDKKCKKSQKQNKIEIVFNTNYDKSEKRKTRKTVNFNRHVIIGDTGSDKIAVDIVQPILTQKVINTQERVQETIKINSESDSSSKEEDDLEGLDEIISDDEERNNSLIQVAHPFDCKTNKVNLGYKPEDTFT